MLDNKRSKDTKEGNFKSIEELCANTWEALYRFVYYRVQNREEAEDITQETYLKAISYLKNGDSSIKSVIAFLKTVALNILRDKWRRLKRQAICLNIDDISPEETATEDDTQINEQREIINSALNMLTVEQQFVIKLRIIKGYSVSETAGIMRKSKGAVRVLQYRALQALNKILKKSFE
ncbi:MAG: RNA polymerase sigma factor [Bacteroidales bacterium]|jgi:RNA polymerase sigma-70 factor (ECF subfamily)|nr:RNA polymerase sigma factor [Bacteroidales bacterium]